MAVVDGTNAGFVTAAPSADPDGGASGTVDGISWAGKFTAPAGASGITEIGWYCNVATEAANFEVGIYDDDGAGGGPGTLLAKSSATAKGTGSGWKNAAVAYSASMGGGSYWLAVALAETATGTGNDREASGGGSAYDLGQLTLINPFVIEGTGSYVYAIYALYTTASGSVVAKAMINRRRRG